MPPCLGNVADGALGQCHLWMTLVTEIGISKEESPFQAQVHGSWQVSFLTSLLWMHHRKCHLSSMRWQGLHPRSER